jgi:Sec-independent protein secretion pathway component TatC
MSDRPREAIMSFGDHLDELRRRAMLALVVPLPLAIVAFLFVNHLRAIIELPLRTALTRAGLSDQMQTRSVTEMMGVDLKLSFIVALVLSGPWIVWQVWKFVEPGLYAHERRFARLLVPGSFLLTIAGICTLYFGLLPITLSVLVQYGLEDRMREAPRLVAPAADAPLPPTIPVLDAMPTEVIPGQVWVLGSTRQLFIALEANGEALVLMTPLARDAAYLQQFLVGEYIDFVLLMMLGVAVAFQMPLVILLLGWVGIIRVELLRSNRRIAFFVLVIIAAIVTPTTDITSMALMTIPLYLLYELGILLLIAVPPGAVSDGNILQGFFSRLRASRRPHHPPHPSGKRPGAPSQTEQPERPVPPTGLPPQTTHPTRREPDGDADEDARGGGTQ